MTVILTLRISSSYDEPELCQTLQDVNAANVSPSVAAALLRKAADDLDPPKRPTR